MDMQIDTDLAPIQWLTCYITCPKQPGVNLAETGIQEHHPAQISQVGSRDLTT